MKFKNETGKDIMVLVDKGSNTWVTAKAGAEIELPRAVGRSYGLTEAEVESVTSTAATKTVETKKARRKVKRPRKK